MGGPHYSVSEVALSLILLVSAGLMMNSFLRLQRVGLGFNPRNLLTADIVLNGTKYWHNLPDIKKRVTPQGSVFFQQVLERVQALPGVTSAGLAHLAPPRYVQTRSFRIISEAAPPPQQEPRAGYNEVSSGYFRTLEMPLRQGRYLTEQDVETAPWVVVINEAMARRFFPNENPVGKQLQLRILGGGSGVNVAEDRPREIVGVVGNIRQWGFDADPSPMMYGSYRQHAWDYPGGFYLGHLWKDLIVRSSSDPMQLAPALQRDRCGSGPGPGGLRYSNDGRGSFAIAGGPALSNAIVWNFWRSGRCARSRGDLWHRLLSCHGADTRIRGSHRLRRAKGGCGEARRQWSVEDYRRGCAHWHRRVTRIDALDRAIPLWCANLPIP